MEGIDRVYVVPGMFGFARLAGYEYCEHVLRALSHRLEDAGKKHRVLVVPTPPTASIRRRARMLAQAIDETCGTHDRVHLVGHSTGGLDCRLLASPSCHLGDAHGNHSAVSRAWLSRLSSVVTLNTPHYGTPLAQFFTSVSGTRLLYALSLLTFTTLRYGGPPLTIFSSLLASIGQLDGALGLDIRVLDSTTELLLRFVGDQGRDEVRLWLDGVRKDQGGIVQITPEAMDLFNATTEDSAHVRYGSIATYAPSPQSLTPFSKIRSAYSALSTTIYTTLYTVTSQPHRHYPCPAPSLESAARLSTISPRPIDPTSNDGIVPTLSMLWGRLLYAERADHLDVLGHFNDDRKPQMHIDWLTSGSEYTRTKFAASMDAVAGFIAQ